MKMCSRCGRRRRRFVPGRSHCVQCQRRASRVSYYRHRLKVLEYKARLRAISYGCEVAYVDYVAVYSRCIGSLCLVCGSVLTGSSPLEVHHILDLAAGGSHTDANVTLVHRRCNRASSARIYLLRHLGGV